MDFRCEICGCKTEPQELKSYTLQGEEINACSFCRKQLESIKKAPKDFENDAKSLLNMNTNGKRSEKVQLLLKVELDSLGVDTSPAVNNQNAFMPQGARVNSPSPAVQNVKNGSLEDEIADLRAQLQALSDSFNGFRKRYIISKIVSIALPVVLIIIMLIIVIASGAVGNLVNYYNTIVDYANM